MRNTGTGTKKDNAMSNSINDWYAMKWYMDRQEKRKKRDRTDCYKCLNRACPVRNDYKRLPREDGGMGLCPKLTGEYRGI